MSYWAVPNEAERQMLRDMGREPEGHGVHRVGKDYLVFLHYKSHKEFTIRIYKKEGEK